VYIHIYIYMSISIYVHKCMMMGCRIENPRILILDSPLEYKKGMWI
jgi:chaperonin GroEL (HSP60 family)